MSPEEPLAGPVLVVGAGNSGCDIACDAARTADHAVISMRRGYWFIPKHLFGRPVDLVITEVIAEPARLANNRPATTGPSSFTIDALTSRPTIDRAPNWSSVMPDCSASTAPVKKPVRITTVSEPRPMMSRRATADPPPNPHSGPTGDLQKPEAVANALTPSWRASIRT